MTLNYVPLNHFQYDLRVCQASVEQAHGEFGFPSAAVEAVAELVEILLEMFGRNTVIGPQQKGLQIANRDMHPGQPLTSPVGWCHPGGVMLGLANRAQGGQLVATHQLAGWLAGDPSQIRRRFPW